MPNGSEAGSMTVAYLSGPVSIRKMSETALLGTRKGTGNNQKQAFYRQCRTRMAAAAAASESGGGTFFSFRSGMGEMSGEGEK
jgi:hypothetical protein